MESLFATTVVPRALRKAIPLSLHLLVTERCDLRCAHCYLPATSRRRAGTMALADYDRLLREARAAGTLFVTLSGGEPTLRPDFMALASLVREHALALRVITNAQGLDGQRAA